MKTVIGVLFFSIFWVAQGFGTTFCTTTNSEDTDCSDGTCWFQSALDAAESNGEDDEIRVARGTYDFEADKSFKYDASEGKSISLKGGYDAACQTQTLDPSNTVIKGDATDYYKTTLVIAQKAGGNVYVEGLTIQNGGGHEGAGLEISTRVTDAGQSADVTVKKNIIKDSVRPDGGQPGGLKVYADDFTDTGLVTGKITIEDNVVTGCSADAVNYAAISAFTSSDKGTASEISMLNNTVTGNDGPGIRAEAETESGTAKGITITGNHIAENQGSGARIAVIPGEGTGGDIRVEGNTIIGNSGNSGGGLYIDAPASSASGRGGGRSISRQQHHR